MINVDFYFFVIDPLLDAHSTLRDVEFYDTCAEWFRFANERYGGREKNNTCHAQDILDL